MDHQIGVTSSLEFGSFGGRKDLYLSGFEETIKNAKY